MVSSVEPSAYAVERGRQLSSSPLAHTFVTRLQVEHSELFAFITDFFQLNADVTGDHMTTSSDFFEYIAFFFGG